MHFWTPKETENMTNDKAKLGLIGIVGEETKRDFWGTMERLAQMGYKGIEGADHLLQLQGDPLENVQRFHGLGLEVLTTSASREQLSEGVGALISRAHSLHTDRVTVWWAPCDTRESVLRDAELFNAAGAQMAQAGVSLCYHHHEHEFLNHFDGVSAMDLLVQNTDPQAVKFVVDIAWAAFGKRDPAQVLRELQGRVASVHLKDLARLDERNHFTALGTGVVDVESGVRAAHETGVEWMVVEQDTLRNLSAMETVLFSSLYLREKGLV
jgi:sugar phosphate isomerase/epimerase